MKNLRNLFNTIFSEPVQQAIKQALRLGLFAVISYLVSFGITYVTQMPQSTSTIVITFVLTAVDKWIHEQSKTENSKLPITGISPF